MTTFCLVSVLEPGFCREARHHARNPLVTSIVIGDADPMSTDIVSRWPIVIPLALEDGDCDDDGRLTEAGAHRMFARARARYFDLCRTIEPATLEVQRLAVAPGSAAVNASGVTISVNVTEIYPDAFTMSARIRPADGPGIAADARCSVFPGGEVSNAVRDEFIALAHNAHHMH
jgi:acyl-CoA thioesterase FadM